MAKLYCVFLNIFKINNVDFEVKIIMSNFVPEK